MKKIFYKLYNNFTKRAKERNKEFLQKFRNLEIDFASKEIMSLIISECLMEDVKTIDKLKKEGFSHRYINCIIRNICEQVIEYKYIMCHQELIKEYFGGNLEEEWSGMELIYSKD